MSAQKSISLARTLPPRLLRFFQKYPPPAIFPHSTSPNPTEASPIPQYLPAADVISTTPPADASAPIIEVSSPEAPSPVPSTSPLNVPAHAHDLPYPNPFLPRKNFTTGRWHGPVYGLRKQADLVKLARNYGVVNLLPWSIKKPGEKEARRLERGLRVKGTGEGQKVKGHIWERTLKSRLAVRRQAMLNMPQLIEEWKWKGHGRGWKKWPSARAKK